MNATMIEEQSIADTPAKESRTFNFTAAGIHRRPAGYWTDAVQNGLQVRISPTGTPVFSVRYDITRNKVRHTKRYTLGPMGDALTVAMAREKARLILQQVRDGLDPNVEKQTKRTADTVVSFIPVYIAEYAKREAKKRTWKVDERMLRREIQPVLGHLLLQEVTRSHVRDLLKAIAQRSGYYSNRVRSLLKTFFAYAVDEEKIPTNPVSEVKKYGVEEARSRVLTHEEIRTYWEACEKLPLEMAVAFKLKLVTGQRRG